MNERELSTLWERMRQFVSSFMSEWEELSVASEYQPGMVMPDGVSTVVDDDGTIHAVTTMSVTETDPTVPAWAKRPEKPMYTAVEVGALPDTTKIPTKTSDLTNDSGFMAELSIRSATAVYESSIGYKATAEDFTAKDGAILIVTFDARAGTNDNMHLKVNNGPLDVVYLNGRPLKMADAALFDGVPLLMTHVSRRWYIVGKVPMPSSVVPMMDGDASVGSQDAYARADHVHPTDTSRLDASLKGAANGVAELDSEGKVPLAQMPSHVSELPVATDDSLGCVKPDGTTITIDPDGTIHGVAATIGPRWETRTIDGARRLVVVIPEED
jgi:hypothetical protein